MPLIKYTNILLLCLSVVVISACNRNERTFEQGYEYSPLTINQYKIYNVQKITYSIIDTLFENFQIKEIITDTFTQGGRLKYRIERFKRLNSSESWSVQPDSVWTAYFDASKLIRTENNIPFIKLVFPVEKGTTWNGNGENTKGAETYKYEWKGSEYTVDQIYFAETASVIHSPNDSNLVKKDYRKEVYALNIGMIHKIQESYYYQQSGGQSKGYLIDNGVKYYERIVSYGQE